MILFYLTRLRLLKYNNLAVLDSITVAEQSHLLFYKY